MTTNETTQSLHPQGLQELLQQTRAESIFHVIPGLYLAALVLIIAGNFFPDPLIPGGLAAMLLFLLPIAMWGALRFHYLAAAWLLIVGSICVVFILFITEPFSSAANLLALSVGLAALYISVPASIATAFTCTLILWFMPFTTVDSPTRASAITCIWGIVILIFLTQRPLISWMKWLWSGWERSSALLEQSRDYQLQLRQTLSDLAEANLQLTRINQLVSRFRQEAEEARRAKEEFVANVSHELRTPLNMIIGFTEMITESPQLYSKHLPARLLADLAIVMRNSQQLSSLIDDVLDLSQADTGQITLVKESVNLFDLVDAAAVAVRPLFESKGLSLGVELPPELNIVCDRTRIRQVMLNLLSNAGRFTESGGVIIRGHLDKDDVVVSVIDTGPGIAKEDVGKLFQPFQQLDGSIRRRHGGSGLGLAISKNLVELHGGRMWVESQPGHGSIFFFRLPAGSRPPIDDHSALRWFNPFAPYEEHAQRSPTPVSRPLPRLVICESGDSLQQLLNRHIPNIEAVPVQTLDEALIELARTPSQALVANTPSVTETLEFLQTTALPLGVPVVVCSIPGVYEVAGVLGLADYLIKPVSRARLLTAVHRFSGGGKTILIVDDDPEVQRLYSRMLASDRENYRVLSAENGKQALDILEQEDPDIILLDLIMPVMDGFQFLAARSANLAWREIPVIGVSAQELTGGHMVTGAMAATGNGGLPLSQLLECIRIIARLGRPGEVEAHQTPNRSRQE